MIWRRREGGLVRTGLNVTWEPLAKNAILHTPWFRWYVSWNRHKRRVTFAVPTGFNWRAPLGPWKRIADLTAELEDAECSRDGWQHRALLLQDRYDKMHEMNTQLRRALSLYRDA